MSSDRTRFITLRLDAPKEGGGVELDGFDDLAAVLQWLGEAAAAGWRVAAHIPQARMALIVDTDADSEDDIDEESDADDTDSGSSGDEEATSSRPSAPYPSAIRANPRPTPLPAAAPPRLRSPSRRGVGAARLAQALTR